MAAALAFFASRAEVGSIAYISARVLKREPFEGRGNPFGAAPVEDEVGLERVRGF
jgi:hypothetical protein